MTSTPASRSARATTFAPRSCPSRPGLAITTRMLLMGTSHGQRNRISAASDGWPTSRAAPVWCHMPITRTGVARAHHHTSLEFWVSVDGRKADRKRGHQQEPPAAPAGQGGMSKRDRSRAAAAARRQAAKRRTRRRRLLIVTAVVLVVGLGTGGLIYASLPPSIT